MSEETIEQRRDRRLAEVLAQLNAWDGLEGIWVYLSFVDEHRPKGGQFAGACIVRAPDVLSAPFIAHRKGINPGGQIAMSELDEVMKAPFMDKYVNRLLSRADLEEIDAEATEWARSFTKTK